MTSPVFKSREQLLAEAAGLSQAPVVSPEEIAAIKEFTTVTAPKLAYDFASAQPTEATVLVLEMAPQILPGLLDSLARDLPALRRFKHAQGIGDTSVPLPGLAPATQANGTTPAAALGAGPGGGTTAPTNDQDPLVAEFAALLQRNRPAAEAALGFVRDAVAISESDPAQYRLVSTALLHILSAAAKPEAARTPEEREWVLVDNGGQPVTVSARNARNAATERDRLRRITGALGTDARYQGVLGSAATMADLIGQGQGGTIPPTNTVSPSGDTLGDLLREVQSKIEEANRRPARP